MHKLEIFNPDGSLYWTMEFNSLDELDKWLGEEKTRPYWKADFTYKKTPVEKLAQPVDGSVVQKSKEARLQLSALKPGDIKDLNDVEQVLLTFKKLLSL